jgi:hypothetical protein
MKWSFVALLRTTALAFVPAELPPPCLFSGTFHSVKSRSTLPGEGISILKSSGSACHWLRDAQSRFPCASNMRMSSTPRPIDDGSRVTSQADLSAVLQCYSDASLLCAKIDSAMKALEQSPESALLGETKNILPRMQGFLGQFLNLQQEMKDLEKDSALNYERWQTATRERLQLEGKLTSRGILEYFLREFHRSLRRPGLKFKSEKAKRIFTNAVPTYFNASATCQCIGLFSTYVDGPPTKELKWFLDAFDAVKEQYPNSPLAMKTAAEFFGEMYGTLSRMIHDHEWKGQKVNFLILFSTSRASCKHSRTGCFHVAVFH